MSTFSSTTIVFLDLYHGAYLSPCVRQRKMHFSSIIYASISGYVDCCFPEIPASENTKTVQNVRLPAHRYRPVSGCVLGRPAVLRKYIPYSTRYSAAYVHETHGQEGETPRANKTDLPPEKVIPSNKGLALIDAIISSIFSRIRGCPACGFQDSGLWHPLQRCLHPDK